MYSEFCQFIMLSSPHHCQTSLSMMPHPMALVSQNPICQSFRCYPICEVDAEIGLLRGSRASGNFFCGGSSSSNQMIAKFKIVMRGCIL
jgi:hypothetical protein